MIELVTLAEAKLWLRVDHDDEDATIAILIGAATEAVLAMADAWDGTGLVPDRLKLACLTRIGAGFGNRESLSTAGDGEERLINNFRNLTI